MDIFKLSYAFTNDPESRRKLDDVVLRAVREYLWVLDEGHERAQRKLDRLEREAAALQKPVDREAEVAIEWEWFRYLEARHTIFRILASLCDISFDATKRTRDVEDEKKRTLTPFIDLAPIEETIAGAKRGNDAVQSGKYPLSYPPTRPPRASSELRRGRRPEIRLSVIAEMRKAIEEGRYTIEQLSSSQITMDALAAEHNCSHTTIRAALNEILGNREADAADT